MKNDYLRKLIYNPICKQIFTSCIIIAIILVLLNLSNISVNLNNFISSIAAIIALIFSFHAYMHNKEQFRLSLFEKRFEVYTNLFKFFEFINSKGDLYSQSMTREEYEKLLGFSQQSFLWYGFHKSTFLFGEDVAVLFKEINELYHFLLTTDPAGNNAQDYYNRFSQLSNLSMTLPIIFRPYLYFGDVKNGYLNNYESSHIP